MAHVIQLALGAFMSRLDVKGLTKFWEAHECDQQFGENESAGTHLLIAENACCIDYANTWSSK